MSKSRTTWLVVYSIILTFTNVIVVLLAGGEGNFQTTLPDGSMYTSTFSLNEAVPQLVSGCKSLKVGESCFIDIKLKTTKVKDADPKVDEADLNDCEKSNDSELKELKSDFELQVADIDVGTVTTASGEAPDASQPTKDVPDTTAVEEVEDK